MGSAPRITLSNTKDKAITVDVVGNNPGYWCTPNKLQPHCKWPTTYVM